MEGGPDKAAVVAGLRGTTTGPVVYVGDSPTDVDALLAADVGVVFGDNPTLREVLALAGVHVEPLLDDDTQQQQPCQRTLYHTRSWHDIATVLL